MAKILVIDDEEIIRRRLKDLLTMDGYETFAADSGETSLEIFRKESPDVVLVDVKMPGMNGIEVLSEVKKISPQTEVIVITGHGGMETTIHALRQNAFDYITKPINYDELKVTIEKALEKQKLLFENSRLQTETQNQRDELKKRLFELDVLYEVSNAISYTLDYQQLLKLVMESLFKIVDYDLCASILFDSQTANITLKPVYSQCSRFLNKVKEDIINSISLLTGEDIDSKQVSEVIVAPDTAVQPEKYRPLDQLRSFFNVPFVVRGKTIGMINVSTCKENAYNEESVKVMYTVANHASSAIERLQAVITAEKSKMESMVESMAEGVMMTDEKGRIVVFNPHAKEMLGFGPAEEISTKEFYKKITGTDMDRAFKEYQDKKSPITKEIKIPFNGKERSTYRCNISPVKNGEETIGTVTVLRDITQEKEMDQTKTEFISMVSHELRTPITIMKGYVSILIDGLSGNINQDQLKHLTSIYKNIERLAIIINDLLDISKLESGKMQFYKSAIDLSPLIKSTVAFFGAQTDAKKIKLNFSFADGLPKVYADPDRIVQVLTNLIGNAVKFTPEGGKISVETSREDHFLKVSVTDTGPGISKENLEKVFDRFEQVGRTSGTGSKGTGLGLSIAKKIVEILGGKIWAESPVFDDGKGSKFTFLLPEYVPEKVLHESLKSGFQTAIKINSSLILGVAQIKGFDILKKNLGDEKIQALIQQLENAVKNAVRGSGDLIVHYEKGKILIILSDYQGKDMRSIKSGIISVLLKEFPQDIALNFGITSFPQDAKTEEELLMKAEKNLEDVKRQARKILVVDDEKGICSTMVRILAKSGYEVSTTMNSSHAIKLIKEEKFDLIFLDLQMPIVDGATVFEEMKKYNPEIQVVIITGYPDSALLLRAMKFKPLTVIAKPFTTTQIVEVTLKLLG